MAKRHTGELKDKLNKISDDLMDLSRDQKLIEPIEDFNDLSDDDE